MNLRNHLSEFGQSLVEFALIFPVLIMILLFVFDLGRMVYFNTVLTNVSREGVRHGIIYAAQHPNESEADVENAISATICGYAISLDLGCPNPSMNVNLIDDDVDCTSNCRNEKIQVQVSYKFSPVTPLVGLFLELDENNQITVNNQSTMWIEH
jgi:Flp pilus assembly protein TadG